MKFSNFTFLITIITFCFAVNIASAQTLPQNLSQLNVNDLSDAQIRQVMMQEQSAGLSDAQLMQQVQSRGLSADQTKTVYNNVSILYVKQGILQLPMILRYHNNVS